MKFLVLALVIAVVLAQKPVPGFRAPAVPLIVQDPYMSIWSEADHLYDRWPSHSSGSFTALCGLIRIDGKAFRWMGGHDDNTEETMEQTNVVIYATRTIYTFEKNGIELTVTFATPSILEEKEYLMLPFSYVNYAVKSLDGKTHNVQVYFDITGEIASSNLNNVIDWNAKTLDGYTVLDMGVQKPEYLSNRDDRISWGRLYIATEETKSVLSRCASSTSMRQAFVNNTSYPDNDFTYRAVNDKWPVLSFVFDLESVSDAVEKTIIFAYDDVYSMNFFGTFMEPLWKHYYETIQAVLSKIAFVQKDEIMKKLASYDEALMEKIYKKIDNDEYITVTNLVYRQVTGGCKWVWNPVENKPWFFMKEISSDSDVSTIDVIYPAVPMFLYLAPDVFQSLMLPLLEYSTNQAYKYGNNVTYNLEWAPHHLGVWPICDTKEDQQEHMPVEETGNMLQLILAVAQRTGDLEYLSEYWELLQKWANYLIKFLPDPGDQLCTDDFMGPSPHNINLAIKGLVGLDAYAELLRMKGDKENAELYQAFANDYYRWFKMMGYDDTHSRLQYNLPNTWSLKYNMIFQNVMNTHLFKREDMQNEVDYYLKNHFNKFGIPLDNRETFTKADWLMWVASMGTRAQFDEICHAFYLYANETNGRMPISDWYWTINSDVKGFRARPVMGGIYMPLLALEN